MSKDHFECINNCHGWLLCGCISLVAWIILILYLSVFGGWL